MKKIIHHLRKQKEEDRRHVLHITMFVCALILFIIWSYNLGSTLAKTDFKEDFQDLNEFKNNISSDLEDFKENNN